ncbi:MAG: PaaI family thioesterase [Candidatus Hydrogenedentes bacterium]|nr:PaaI family thioesterase [Candidatus Hydrogenedentota bacterium]
MNEDTIAARMREIFDCAPFVRWLGMEVLGAGEGWCETLLLPREELRQQNGFLHAGVVSTMADHTAGASAGTVLPPGISPLTAEYKINLLRPALGDRFRCRADVLKPGKTLVIAESSVYAITGDTEKLIAKALVTLAAVKVDLLPPA